MAYLVFADGSEKQVGYNQAAKIHQILLGNKKPENKEQELFCSTVAGVKFEPLRQKERLIEKDKKQPDAKLKQLMGDDSLKGYAKFLAIGNRLKEITN